MDLISDSHVPKYAQIADIFRQRIARGIWAQGLRLPANEVLAAEFGVSRVTIRQAVDLLARDGIIEAQQGRGTFITGMLKQDRWLKVETTLSDLAEVYRDTSPEIINISESRTDAPLLPEDGKPAAHYVFMRRVHSRDKRPYCVISIYLDEKIFRKCPKRFRKETVIPILKDMRDPADQQRAADADDRHRGPRSRKAAADSPEFAGCRSPAGLHHRRPDGDLSRRSHLSRGFHPDRHGSAALNRVAHRKNSS